MLTHPQNRANHEQLQSNPSLQPFTFLQSIRLSSLSTFPLSTLRSLAQCCRARHCAPCAWRAMSGARSGGQQRYFSLQSKALESQLTYSISENQGLLFLSLLYCLSRSYYLACWTQCRWCRCHSAGCRFCSLVLSSLRARTTRHDAARRRVSSRSPMLVRRDPS